MFPFLPEVILDAVWFREELMVVKAILSATDPQRPKLAGKDR